MSSNGNNIKAELGAIFPQHNEDTIRAVYDNVVNNLNEEIYALVLPACINVLLELSPTSAPQVDRIPLVDNGRTRSPIPGLDLSDSDSNSSSDDSNSSSDRESVGNQNINYRNRQIFGRNMYRETSNRLSPESDSSDLFPNEDDLLFLSEDINKIEEAGNKNSVSRNCVIIRDSPLQNRKRKLSVTCEHDQWKKLNQNTLEEKVNFLVNDNETKENTISNGTIDRANFCTGQPNDLNASSNISLNASEVQPSASFIRKGMDHYLEIAKEQIQTIIVDVDDVYLKELIQQQGEDLTIPQVVNQIVEFLLDKKDYPKLHKSGSVVASEQSSSNAFVSSNKNLFIYERQSMHLLQNAFPKISTKSIRSMFHKHDKKYTKTFIALENLLEEIISGKSVNETSIKSFMKGVRHKISISSLEETLTAEVKELEKKKKEDLERGDLLTASAINIKQYEEEGQTIECGCCYGEVAFEEMVQCPEGHLFCVCCLRSYSKEAIYGSGKSKLYCMTSECSSEIPLSQLKKALSGDMLAKYLERIQEEDLKLANLDNLIKCPFCEFAAEMDDGDKVFKCQNPSCMKESCRYCQVYWGEHFGVPCNEIEKKGAIDIRTTYEEKMTEAKVRKCWQCCTVFLKSDGCNKMTCRCGAKMCYICRTAKINYEHFCSHPRNPGEGCKKCNKCSLWTDPSEDDDHAVAEIKRVAEDERLKLAGEDAPASIISVGPKISIDNKRRKK